MHVECVMAAHDHTACLLPECWVTWQRGSLPATHWPLTAPRLLCLPTAPRQVCVVALKKGQLQVLSNAWDRDLGGRDLDAVLFEHFVK